MDRKRLFKILTYLIILIFLVNSVATKLYWYNSIWYFDMIMHFLGGFWVGLVSIYFFSQKKFSFDSLKTILKILLFVLFVGISWEIFEIVFNNIIAQNPFNTLDTISDVFFDLSGGAFALLYYFRRTMRIRENEVK